VPRDAATRKSDSLRTLATPEIDVWVATASTEGRPHLVPLSLAWLDEHVVIAVHEASRTFLDLRASGVARAAVGPTRDVTMLDVELERTVPVDDDAELGERYAAQADWDPRGLAGYHFLVLRPTRVQAWQESDEIPGRTLMRERAWVI
jgi:Pyridoxamine 5'-phosphate oxidase